VVVVVVELVVVELDDVVELSVVGAAGTVEVGAGAADESSEFADGSTASTWLQAATNKQVPISNAVPDVRTTSNLQSADACEDLFRSCSPTTHSVDEPLGP
jgi:hypothetical protein